VAELDRVLEAGVVAEPCLLVIYDLDGFKFYNDTFGHPAGDALLARLAAALERVVEPVGSAYRLGGDEFCALVDVPPLEIEAFCEATVAALSEIGDGFDVSSSYGAVFLPDEATTPSDALRLADQRLYVQKRERSGRPAPHEILLEALYEHSPGLRAHVENVAASAVAVGASLGMRGEDIEELRLAARLHDIGKLAIPDAILLKPASLTPDEWSLMQRHAEEGARIIDRLGFLNDAVPAIRHHHERFDGTGYPDRLRGEEIPLGARIIHVADALDSMLTTRIYRAARPAAEALAELRRAAGTQFCPRCVGALERILPLDTLESDADRTPVVSVA
jgi:diguanylate cyclase (GGDEF)-like protein/putative nucleotidyltransferase with HDIG domain